MDKRWFAENQNFPSFNNDFGHLTSFALTSTTKTSNQWTSAFTPSNHQQKNNATFPETHNSIFHHGHSFGWLSTPLPAVHITSAFAGSKEDDSCEYNSESAEIKSEEPVESEEKSCQEGNLAESECIQEINQERREYARRKRKMKLNQIDFESEMMFIVDRLEHLHLDCEFKELIDEAKPEYHASEPEIRDETILEHKNIIDLRDLHLEKILNLIYSSIVYKSVEETHHLIIKPSFMLICCAERGLRLLRALFSLALLPNRKSRKKSCGAYWFNIQISC